MAGQYKIMSRPVDGFLPRLGAVPIVPALPGKHMEYQARRGEGVGWAPATEAQRRMGFQGLVW